MLDLALSTDSRTPESVPGLAVILVVDDSPIDRHFAAAILGKNPQWQVVEAVDSVEALELLAEGGIDGVVTDMVMPRSDGLELVEEVRRRYPLVPVILMTGHGSEEAALQALQRGASSYVSKRNLAKELSPTLQRVLAAADLERTSRRVLGCMTHMESYFILENDPTLFVPLVKLIQEHVAGMGLVDATTVIRLGVALEEALTNALYHGNLQLGSPLHDLGAEEAARLIDERSRTFPYRTRRIHVNAKFTAAEAIFIIRDEGEGFDTTVVNNPESFHGGGRGLRLMRSFMDEVIHNRSGNQVTMVLRKCKVMADESCP